MKFKGNLKFIILLFYLSLSNNVFSIPASKDLLRHDSIRIEKYINHINTLNYISRKNTNDPYFLNLSFKYSDSILSLDANNEFALSNKLNVDLTRSTIEKNVINKFQLFDFFAGIPIYYGFIDDPIEYAYDDALQKLLNTKYFQLHNGPISESNITSLLVKNNCDKEMFEIINQTLILNSKHHILQKNHLSEIFQNEQIDSLINGKINENRIQNILNKLKLDRIGIFTVSDIDVIDNKVWLVKAEFKTYIKDKGFTEPIFTKGYNIDKRNYDYLWLFKFLLVYIFFTLFFLGCVNFLVTTLKSIFNNSQTKIIQISDLNAYEVWIELKKHLIYIFVPIVLSFLLIYLCSNFIPSGDQHYLEINVLFWLFCLTFSVSFLPLIINLFFVNRLNFDGFHTIKGYSKFASSSLISSYFPFFVFYNIKYGINFPHQLIILLFLSLIFYLIGQIYGQSFFDLTSKSRNKTNNISSILGILIGFVSLYGIIQLTVFEFSIYNLMLGILISLFSTVIFFYLKNYWDKVEKRNKFLIDKIQEKDEIIFVESVINIYDQIFNIINSKASDDLNIYLISAPKGIGKTTIINEVKNIFLKNNWNWFYGDCDEIQTDNSISFEPFFQAFSDLLKTNKLIDRTSSIEKLTGNFINTTLDNTIGINPLSDFKINIESSINNMCLEIIEKLENLEGNIILIMEDLHFIDSETFSFLKHFLKTINRNQKLRNRFKVILTLRNDFQEDYRGVSHEELINELSELNSTTEKNILTEVLLTKENFNIQNFLFEYNKLAFIKIASNSLIELNQMFNSIYNENLNSNHTLTPLYILKMIDHLINNQILKLSPEGYILIKSLESDFFPNFDEVDIFYHKIFDEFEKKWIRLLESATIIGSKFDADTLSQVWDYNLLEVLTFLESAVEKEILIDLSEEDNFYEFKDKRIVSAVKSYFKNDLIQFRGEKQIIIEYNKRYLDLVNDQLTTPEKHEIEVVLKLIRRLISLKFIDRYFERLNTLILDVVLRYLYNYQHEKINVLGKFLKKNHLDDVGELIIDLSIISNHFDSTDEKKHLIIEKIRLDHDKTNELPIDQNHTRNILNDLRLLVLLNSAGGWFSSKRNLIGTKSLGFEYIDFSTSDWLYLTNEFPKKLKGISKLQFVKEYLKDLLTMGMLITDFEFDISPVEEKHKYELLLNEIFSELKGTKFEYIINVEIELYKLNYTDKSNITNEEKASLNNIDLDELSTDQSEEIVEIDSHVNDLNDDDIEEGNNENSKKILEGKLGSYIRILDKIIYYDDKSLYSKVLSSFLLFTNIELRSYEESINNFLKYNDFLLQDGSPTELWVITYLNFLNSTTCTCKKTLFRRQCNCDRTGEIFIIGHSKEVKNNLNRINNYLYKIIESNTLSSISNLLFEVQKLFYLLTKEDNNFLKLIDKQKEKIIRTYSDDSIELTKFLVNNSVHFTKLGFFKKSNQYIQEVIRKMGKNTPIFSLSQQYFGLSINFKGLNDLPSALKNIDFSLTTLMKSFDSLEGWKIVDNKLIPLTNDPQVLFLYGKPEKMKIKPSIKFLSRIFQEYGIIYNRLGEFILSNQYFDDAIIYLHEEYSYTRYHIINLQRGINYKQIDNKEGEKIIKFSIDKLKENLIPDHDKVEFENLKSEINRLIKSLKI